MYVLYDVIEELTYTDVPVHTTHDYYEACRIAQGRALMTMHHVRDGVAVTRDGTILAVYLHSGVIKN